jgi:hypothetical protein
LLLVTALLGVVSCVALSTSTTDAVAKAQFQENYLLDYLTRFPHFKSAKKLSEIVDITIGELNFIGNETRFELDSYRSEFAMDMFLSDFLEFTESKEEQFYYLRNVAKTGIQRTNVKKVVPIRETQFLIVEQNNASPLVIEGGKILERGDIDSMIQSRAALDADGQYVGDATHMEWEKIKFLENAEYLVLNQETLGAETLYLVSFAEQKPIWLRSAYFADKSAVVYNHPEFNLQTPFRIRAKIDLNVPERKAMDKNDIFDVVEEAGKWYPVRSGTINTPNKDDGFIDKRFVEVIGSPEEMQGFGRPQPEGALVVKDSVGLDVYKVTNSWKGKDDRVSYRLVHKNGGREEILWLPEDKVEIFPELPFDIVLTRTIEVNWFWKMLESLGIWKSETIPVGTILRVLDIDESGKFSMIVNQTNVSVTLNDLDCKVIYPEVESRLVVKIGRPARRQLKK